MQKTDPLLENETTHWFSRRGLPIICFLAVFGIYLHAIDGRPLWWDEGFSIYAALLPLSDLLRETAVDVHPPAYYILLKGWMSLAGTTPFAARTLSAIAGILTIPLLYTTGNRLAGRTTGLAAMLLGLSAPFLMVYSRETRMYSLGMMLVVLSTYAYIRIFTGSGNSSRWWLLYIISTGLGYYTQYAFFLLPAAQGIAVLISWVHDRKYVRNWLITWAILLTLFSPWVLFSSTQLHDLGNQRLGRLAVHQIPLIFQRMATGYAVSDGIGNVLLAYSFAFFALWGAIKLFKKQIVTALPILLTVIGSILLASAVSFMPNEGLNRVMKLTFPGVPMLILLVAAGIAALVKTQRWIGFTVIAILTVTGFSFAFSQELPVEASEDYRPLISRLEALSQPDDAVMTAYVWQDGYFESYAPELPLSFYRLAYDAQSASPLLQEVFDSHDRVWIINHHADIHDLNDPFNLWLHNHAVLVTETWHGTTQLSLFIREGDFSESWPAQADFQNNVTLNYVPTVSTVKAGDSISVDLRWGVDETIDRSYKAFLHLGESNTPPIAQNDQYPVDGLVKMEEWSPDQFVVERRALLIPLDAVPGNYYLFVGVYDPQNGERLHVIAPTDCDMLDTVCVGRIEITD